MRLDVGRSGLERHRSDGYRNYDDSNHCNHNDDKNTLANYKRVSYCPPVLLYGSLFTSFSFFSLRPLFTKFVQLSPIFGVERLIYLPKIEIVTICHAHSCHRRRLDHWPFWPFGPPGQNARNGRHNRFLFSTLNCQRSATITATSIKRTEPNHRSQSISTSNQNGQQNAEWLHKLFWPLLTNFK